MAHARPIRDRTVLWMPEAGALRAWRAAVLAAMCVLLPLPLIGHALVHETRRAWLAWPCSPLWRARAR
ncbi:hypothetical protein [Streptomyces flaveus]|uniref:Uncharacterized protein n=1 Tax=Streptomyces flaveus TaxID=66370 RepID=A0A917QZF6_9ACTN|nr:hypothetical protein [Streptomyces flaveus]GGK76857.1 hypothetical protein GCM10010094_42580 [Streptomyces flaveus]